METYILEKDIPIIYVTAKSFPEGVLEAHQKLHALIPFSVERNYFGISSPNEKGVIIYKAAAELKEGHEAEKLGCNTMILQKGNYISKTIHDYKKNVAEIGNVFSELIHTPGIDPKGACVEWYINDNDVKCMVRLK
jgi:hypothetical protein